MSDAGRAGRLHDPERPIPASLLGLLKTAQTDVQEIDAAIEAEQTAQAALAGAEGGSAGGGAIEPLWAQAPDNGFLAGWSTTESLEAGTVIDRYGGETGRFFSPEGTPFEARSLPAGSGPLNQYEVLKPFDVQAGLAAPAFGEPGLGIQYMSSQTVADLIRAGFIKPVGP